MKTDIKHEGIWWSYIQICDRCGKLICDHAWRGTAEPDMQEVDFCLDCLKYFLNNKIPYEDMKKRYKQVL
jgi:hypothetical protein